MKVLKNNLFLLKKVWKYSKFLLFYIVLCGLVNAILNIANVIGIQKIIEQLPNIKDNISPLIMVIISYLIIYLLCNIFLTWSWYFIPLASEKVKIGIASEKIQASRNLDFSCFDDSDFYDKYTRFLNSGESQVMSLIGILIALLNNTFTIVGLSVAFLSYSPFLLVSIVLEVALTTIIYSLQKKIDYDFDTKNTTLTRKINYFKALSDSKYTQREDKIFNVLDFVNLKFLNYGKEYIQKEKKHSKKINSLSSIINFLSFITLSVTIVISCYLIYNDKITISIFVAILTGVSSLKAQMQSFVSQIPNFINNALYVENYKYILNYTPKIENTTGLQIDKENIKTLEFKNVSFSYPNSNTQCLKNISFKINNGEYLSIVGENGAGKSTIIKLILRLYDPSEGEILLNGINIKKYDIKSYRKVFSTIFQEYCIYNFTVNESITFDNNNPDISSILSIVDLKEKIDSYPLKDKSEFSKFFDNNGILFSYGEQQRLGIARAMYKDASIIILDEPSASLDAVMEEKISNLIMNELNATIRIVISHKLSLTKNANKIIVIENGCLIEQGTHNELMSKDGKYAYLFNLQLKNYL